MRRLLWSVAAGLFFLHSTQFLTSAPEKIPATLQDGGFEEELTVHWGTGEYQRDRNWWSAGGAKTSAARDMTQFKSGRASLKIVNETPLSPNQYGTICQRVAVRPKTRYLLSFWAKGQNAKPGTLELTLDTKWNWRAPTTSGNYDWTYFEKEYHTQNETHLDVRILSEDAGTAWVDDIQLKALPPKSEAVLLTGLTLGEPVALGAQNADPAGGKLTFSDPAGKLGSVTLDVPANAYAGGRSIDVTFKPVQNPTPSPLLNIISPVVEIHAGDQPSKEPLNVTISAKVPKNHFAMGFYLHPKTGALEGIPTVELADDHVTLSTTHFSEIFVAAVSLATLNTAIQQGIDSGFFPGIDDWQFVNNGSAVAPGGHCAGQSLTMMWYYCAQKQKTKHALFNYLDNNLPVLKGVRKFEQKTPKFTEDDSLGYRFCSVVQKDIPDSWLIGKIREWRGSAQTLHWYSFAYSILMTREPQLISITGKDKYGEDVGHAMVVYKVSGDRLFICDPNYPGQVRFTRFHDGAFEPYQSGANAEEIRNGNSVAFDKIGYAAKTAYVPWSQIETRWAELQSCSVGTGLFPDYSIAAVKSDGTQEKIGGLHVTDESNLKLTVTGKNAPAFYTYVYSPGNGSITRPPDDTNVPLQPGKNIVGIHVVKPDASNNGSATDAWHYVDFRWIQIHCLKDDLIDPFLFPAYPDGFGNEPVPLTYHYVNGETSSYQTTGDHQLAIRVDAGDEGAGDVKLSFKNKISLTQQLRGMAGKNFDVQTDLPEFTIQTTSDASMGSDGGKVEITFTQNGISAKVNGRNEALPGETAQVLGKLKSHRHHVGLSGLAKTVPIDPELPQEMGQGAAPVLQSLLLVNPPLPGAKVKPGDTWAGELPLVQFNVPLTVKMQYTFLGYELVNRVILCAKIQAKSAGHAVAKEFKDALTGMGGGGAADMTLQNAKSDVSGVVYFSLFDGCVISSELSEKIDATFVIKARDGEGHTQTVTMAMKLNGSASAKKTVAVARLYHDKKHVGLKRETPFKNNVLHGMIRGWWPNGGKSIEFPFDNGLRHGAAKLFFNTAPFKEMDVLPFVKDRLEGTRKRFYSDGRPYEDIAYVNGVAHGVRKKYHLSGAVAAEMTYVNGVRHGKYRELDESGREIVTADFENGKPKNSVIHE